MNPEIWAEYGALGLIVVVLITGIALVCRWAAKLIERALEAFIAYLKEATATLAEMRDNQLLLFEKLKDIESRLSELEEAVIKGGENTRSVLTELLQDTSNNLEIFIQTIKDFKK